MTVFEAKVVKLDDRVSRAADRLCLGLPGKFLCAVDNVVLGGRFQEFLADRTAAADAVLAEHASAKPEEYTPPRF